MKAYMVRYSGYTVMPVGYHGFPLWLRRGGFLAAAAFYQILLALGGMGIVRRFALVERGALPPRR